MAEAQSQAGSGTESAIRVYLRARPSGDPSPGISLDVEESQANFSFETPTADAVNNSKTYYSFPFSRVFGPSSQQEDVFSVVARPVLDEFLAGKNGCIFAYGQSGSGKTFSLTGGSERYADRGVIPRSLEYLYGVLGAQASSGSYTVTMSYLEIYNGVAYDLLSPTTASTADAAAAASAATAGSADSLPRVSLQEDEFGNFHLSTSVMAAPSEEEALNLLFLGSIRRSVAETNLNLNSSRSHCVLLVELVTRPAAAGAEQYRSRLYFVDLAGSERVAKTGSEGRVLVESKNINQSLHFLEQVIVALHDKARGLRSHIPYRNTLLTAILKDALGGNSNTVMLATIALDQLHVLESVSTCRFAQRVALVKNVVTANKEQDPLLLVASLKKQVALLKEELAILNASSSNAPEEVVTSEEAEILKRKILAYVANEADALVCGSVAKVRLAFSIFRQLVVHVPPVPASPAPTALQPLPAQPLAAQPLPAQPAAETPTQAAPSTAASSQDAASESTDPGAISRTCKTPILTILLDRTKAFEAFRTMCPEKASEISAEDKERLKGLCVEGKTLGERANAARSEIARLRQKLESMRLCDAMRSADGEVDETTAEYVAVKKEISDKMDVYQHSADQLKTIKAEIDRIQFVANQNKHKIQREFEIWYADVRKRTDLDKATAADERPHNQTAENAELTEYYRIRDQILNS